MDMAHDSTGSASSLYGLHKQRHMASNYKGFYGIFYKISMEDKVLSLRREYRNSKRSLKSSYIGKITTPGANNTRME